MRSESLKLKKVRPVDRDIVRKYSITGVKELPVGGREGKKYQGSVVFGLISWFERDQSSKRRVHVIDKEYNENSKITVEDVRKICLGYSFLRKRGYPVPGLSRYYVDKKGMIHLVLSDVIEKDAKNQDKQRIWGWSNNMTPYQSLELEAMNLTADDIQLIRKKALALALKATEDHIELYQYYFHILQDKETRELSVCLLDIDSSVLENQDLLFSKEMRDSIKGDNELAVKFFLSNLSYEQRQTEKRGLI